MNTETKIAEPPHFDFTNMTAEDGKPIVRYFYSRYCSACKALRPEIDRLEAQYSGVEWREYDIVDQNGTQAYRAFADQYNLTQKQRLVPAVLVNRTIITDRFNINSSLEGILKGLSAP
jgi:thiol-disulfide isomerase/thioredoxin